MTATFPLNKISDKSEPKKHFVGTVSQLAGQKNRSILDCSKAEAPITQTLSEAITSLILDNSKQEGGMSMQVDGKITVLIFSTP